jgi:hypothetical protein
MTEKRASWIKPVILQALVGIAVWMTLGVLLEGLIGFKTPAYLQDSVRRELFRLAHAHGTLLSLLLLGIGLLCDRFELELNPAILWALRLGVITLPLGFLLGGVWHFESDPGLGIWLVPVSAVVVVFAIVGVALEMRKR